VKADADCKQLPTLALVQRVTPPLIMNRKELLQKKLLEQLAITPMTRTEMADFLEVSVVFIARYITQLRTSQQIYIHHNEITPPKRF